MKKLIAFFVLLALFLMGLAKLGIIQVEEATPEKPKPTRQTQQTKQPQRPKPPPKEREMKSAPAREQGAALDMMNEL